jgi:DNA-binding CsgD family transcriptional regulator
MLAALGVGAGTVGAALLLGRYVAGDTTFFSNPLVVGGLAGGLAAAAWSAIRRSRFSVAHGILVTGLGALLLAAALALTLHVGWAVALTSALRIPLIAALAFASLQAAHGTGLRVLHTVLGTVAGMAFVALLLFAPQQTPFGDYSPLVALHPAALPVVGLAGMTLAQLVTASLVVVPVWLWATAVRTAPAARTRPLTLAAIASAPVLLYPMSLLLTTWRGDSESLAAAAWLTLGMTVGAVSVGTTLLDRRVRPEHADPPLTSLTRRENEILALLADGATNQGIADRLTVSKRTVDAHVRSLFAKLGVAGEGNPRVRAASLWRRHLAETAGPPEGAPVSN